MLKVGGVKTDFVFVVAAIGKLKVQGVVLETVLFVVGGATKVG